MAKHVFKDGVITFDGTDLSDHVQQFSFVKGRNTQPASGMGQETDTVMSGTKKVTNIKAKFFQDYGASSVYATLNALHEAGDAFDITAKATSAATSATNPIHTLPVIITDLPIIDGSRGDAHMVDVTFELAGDYSVATT